MKILPKISFYTAGLWILLSINNTKAGDLITVPLKPFPPDTISIEQSVQVRPFNLNIVPPSSGIQFYKDGIIFLSSSKLEGKISPEHISFGKTDTKYAVLRDTLLENQQSFSASASFAYPTDACTFSADYKTMYFTRYSESDGLPKIYRAVSDSQGTWNIDDNPLSFCSGQFTYTHPALSADGKIMVFASNRSGTIGGMDLFVTQVKEGNWSNPVNLGDAVNSISNEMYPYLDAENNLFFSSNGIQGFGGYDVFVCKFIKNTWEKPVNLSLPVNTQYDDIAFTISRKDGNSAFYTVKQNSVLNPSRLYLVTKKTSDISAARMNLSQLFTSPAISHIVILVTEPAVQATDRITETAKPRTSSSARRGNITYRVQFMTSFNPKTRQQVTVGGNDYSVYEYLYNGAYRLCAGEYSSLGPAKELLNTFKNDYPQAILVAFENNVRSLDPALFEDEPASDVMYASVQSVTTGPQTPAPTQTPVIEPVSKEIKEPEIKPETKPEVTSTASVKTKPEPATPVAPATTPPAQAVPAATPTVTKPSTTATDEKKDVVVYRVQILTTSSSKGSYKITVDNKVYDTYEYNYSGAFRTTVGEFENLQAAKDFQTLCRKSGYPQAFVVAFKNNIRSLDAALFK